MSIKNTYKIAIEELPMPKIAVIPLIQHIGSPSKPVVKTGDIVKTGQLIAELTDVISARIHSPVSGKVLEIEKRIHPYGCGVESIVIESDEQDDTVKFNSKDPNKLFPNEIVDIIKNAGIVGLGGACFPTHIKLCSPREKKIDSVILNGCECEPYLTCDYRVILEETEKVIGGLMLMMKIHNANNGCLVIGNIKKSVLKKLKDEVQNTGIPVKGINIISLKSKYPQGAERQLVETVFRKKIPYGKLPYDVGCIVHNVQTAKAVYEAVYIGKPLFERIITVAGSIKDTGNYKVRIGTPISEIINYCGGLVGDVKKIILGGPMMGISQYSLDVPVTKGTLGIVALNDKESKIYETTDCIRCGRCVSKCPEGLVPMVISQYVENEKYFELADYNPLACKECGICEYECPAKIHLVQKLRIAKQKMSTLKY